MGRHHFVALNRPDGVLVRQSRQPGRRKMVVMKIEAAWIVRLR
jgi:hypothetical protein